MPNPPSLQLSSLIAENELKGAQYISAVLCIHLSVREQSDPPSLRFRHIDDFEWRVFLFTKRASNYND